MIADLILFAPPPRSADPWPLCLCVPFWLASSLGFWLAIASLLFCPSLLME